MKHLRYVQIAAFGLLVVAYVAIRFWGLTSSCLWFDEIFSIHAAEHSWNTLFSFVALDLIHPPLFYVLLKLWIGVGGENLAWLRMFPALFSIVSLVPLILFLREVKQNTQVQLICLFLLTVNGSLLKYSQEVRMYSLLMCIALFSMWLFARYFVKGKSFIPLLIVNILLVYTHYFGWFVVVSEIVAILVFQRIKWRRILTMFAIIFAGFVPWIFAVWQAAHSGSELSQNIGWVTRPGPREVFTFVINLIEPFYYQASSIDPISFYRVSIPILLIGAVSVVLYILNWKHQSDDEKQCVYLLINYVMLPVVAAFAASWLLPYSIWGSRHLIIVFAPVSIILAIALSNIRIHAVRVAALTITILFSGYGFVSFSANAAPDYSWCAWEPLVEQASIDDVNIYAFEDLVAYHIWFAERNRQKNAKVFRVRDIEGIAEDKAYFLPRGFEEIVSIDFDDIHEPKFWIAYRFKSIDEREPPLRNFIVKGYHIVDQRFIAARNENAIFLLLEK